MALDATVGGAAANSYLTVAEAVAILEDRMYAGAFIDTFGPTEQAQALISATEWLSAATCWTGAASTSTQRLVWPRTGMANRNGFAIAETVLPDELKMATARLAARLATTDVTAENEAAVQGITRVKAGPVEVEYRDDGTILPYRDHPAAPLQHWSTLPADILALLPPSWLCTRPTGRFFEVL